MKVFSGHRKSLRSGSGGCCSFESLVPSIKRSAEFAFRRTRREQRVELIAEVIANAYSAFVRLVQRGLTGLIYPSALARFAIRQVIAGRRVGSRQNVRDVCSDDLQRKRDFTVRQLSSFTAATWEGILADHKAGPAELATCKLDFRAWLAQLSRLERAIAIKLVLGHTTGELAKTLGLSPGRVSQLRRQLRSNWDVFQGLSPAF